MIDDAGFFQLRARISGDSGNLRPGSYEFREDMSFAAALDVLKEGVPPDVVQVGIPEGLSRKEIRPLTAGLRGNYTRATRRSPSLDPRDYGAERADQPRGLPVPGHLRAEEGPAAWPACASSRSRTSSATSERSTSATRSART